MARKIKITEEQLKELIQEQSSSRFAAIQQGFNNQTHHEKKPAQGKPEPKLLPGKYTAVVNKDMSVTVETPQGKFLYKCYKYSPTIKLL